MNKGEELANKYKARISRNMDMAAIHFVNRLKVNLNASTKYRISGQRRIALTRAVPGSFPRKITGFLQKSCSWSKLAWDTVKAGTTAFYAKVLEFTGYSFLRRTYQEEKATIRRIILK